MILNEQYSFSDVRYQISSKVGIRMPRREPDGARKFGGPPVVRSLSYDVELAFTGRPDKKILHPGTPLYRLDFPITFGLFMNSWWMSESVLKRLIQSADGNAAALRRAWQHSMAMAGVDKGVRTKIVEIALTQNVWAWIGTASPLNNKPGGLEQIYLPNLAVGAGPERSNYAVLRRTYTLPAL
jgi:hypothetical protein